jgi:hypothetical protein
MTVRMTSPSMSTCARRGVESSNARDEATIVVRVCLRFRALSSFKMDSGSLPKRTNVTMLSVVTSFERTQILAAQSGLLALGLLLLP